MKTRTTDNNLDLGLDLAKLLGGAAAGALLMYMLDPDRGGARRAQSAAAVRTAGSRTTSALGSVWRGAGSRLGAVAGNARDGAADLADAAKPDGAVKSSLSRIGQAAGELLDDTVSRAKSVASRASDAADDVLSKASSAVSRAGDTAGDLASRITSRAQRAANETGDGLDDAGARVRSALPATLRNTDWSATMRNPAVVGGGLLGLYGLARRSPLGLVLGLAGAALLARGVTGRPLRSLLSGRSLPSSLSHGLSQTIDFEKSIHINASPEEVYDLWANYENFPRFMSHVVEVRDLGRRRSHWVVKGPGGTEFEWNSVLTEQSRPHRLAWRSEPGAEIPQAGSIQFERYRGGTLVTIRMSYTPPAGVLGHGLATLLGSDPKSQMDDDLARMKAFIERGDASRAASKASSRPGAFSRFLH
jgi:uncharacterized membrane protein/ElaB/YqjD/DUF883 family membrane-anchored ribosome-binding protein